MQNTVERSVLENIAFDVVAVVVPAELYVVEYAGSNYHFLPFDSAEFAARNKWCGGIYRKITAVDVLGFGELHQTLPVAPKTD